MEQDKRKKRALILLLFGLLCTAGATYVAMDGKRSGDGLSASNKDKDDQSLAAAAGAGGGKQAGGALLASAPEAQFMGQETPLQPEVPLVSVRRHVADAGGGSGAGTFKGNSEDDLFKAGDPAAGIPSGKFVVAQNDGPSTAAEQAAGGVGPAPSFARPDVGSGALAPTGNAGPTGDDPLRTAAIGSDTPAAVVPEATPLAMMGLGALFLAMVASRRRA